MNKKELDKLNMEFEDKTPQEILQWAVKTFGNRMALFTSWGKESMTVLDMLQKIDCSIPVVHIDTKFEFPEILALQNYVNNGSGYKVNFHEFSSPLTPKGLAKKYGPDLHIKNQPLCCGLMKVKPAEKAMKKLRLRAYIGGLRRNEGGRADRSPEKLHVLDEIDGLIRISPLANWSEQDVWNYLRTNKVPYAKELYRKFPNTTCKRCTLAGRWQKLQRKYF